MAAQSRLGEAINRAEFDSIGSVMVPAESLYGIHTARAMANFPLGQERTIGDFPLLVKGLLRIKTAAATANHGCGYLSHESYRAIRLAADRLISNYDPRHFPVHHLHGGGGTSANMNVNEVIANLAEEILGGNRGDYKLVSLLKTVNLNQSTNDVYPTACHLALIWGCQSLCAALDRLTAGFQDLESRGKQFRRMAKTCLQDAVEVSYGDLFEGYSAVVARSIGRIQQAAAGLLFVNLGGTMVGRYEDVPADYFERILPALREETGLTELKRTPCLFDGAQNLDDMANLSSQLALFARSLIKICQDLRLLASGPQFGFREIAFPPVQEGSSFKAGKFNPVILEFVIQACFSVIGNNTACSSAVDHSELDLSVWESLVAFKGLHSMELLDIAISALTKFLKSIQPTPQL